MSQSKPKPTQKQPGVDPLARRQVALDIHTEMHTADAIHLFDKGRNRALDEMLNNPARKVICAACGRGTKNRRKIRDLVQWWKQHKKEDYLKRVHVPYILNKQATSTEPDNDFGNCDTELDCESEDHTPELENIEEKHPKRTVAPKSSKKQPFEKSKNEPSKKQLVEQSKNDSPNNKNMTRNELGKKLIVPLPKGLILCVIWVDSKLSNLDVVFGEDGYSIKMKSRMPNPTSATQLLSHCSGWAADADNVVISAVDDALDDLRNIGSEEKWKETEMATFDEELLKAFVDNKGNPLVKRNIGHNTDSDGRQIITFFLKTMKAHRAQQTAAKGNFATTNGAADGPAGMDVGGDQESHGGSVFEETIDDARADMDDRFNDMSNRMQQGNAEMKQQMANLMNMMSGMNEFVQHAQRAHQVEQQHQQQTGFVFNGSQAQPQPQPQQPAPDSAFSS